jgi:membrane protease YdiL (CAAX protease family)
VNKFTHNRHGLVRVPWRIFIYLLALAGGLIAIGLVTAIFLRPGDGDDIATGLSDLSPWLVSLTNIGMILVVLLGSYLLVRFFDKRTFASLGIGLHGKWVSELLIGLLMGAAMISAIVFLQVLGGAVQLRWGGFAAPVIAREFVPYAILFITVGIQEELLFRGYLLQVIAEGIGKVGAALLLSIPFGILHYFNSGGTMVGAIATGVAGLLLCFAYFRTRSLWLPIGLHITWNFTMSWIFGLPVSGEQLPRPPIQGIVGEPTWLSGGQFGPEGSVLCFVGMGVMALLIYRSGALAPCPKAIEWYPPPEERGTLPDALSIPDSWESKETE